MPAPQVPDPSEKSVLVTTGAFAGQEGVCLGPAQDDGGIWAVSPHSSEQIMNP